MLYGHGDFCGGSRGAGVLRDVLFSGCTCAGALGWRDRRRGPRRGSRSAAGPSAARDGWTGADQMSGHPAAGTTAPARGRAPGGGWRSPCPPCCCWRAAARAPAWSRCAGGGGGPHAQPLPSRLFNLNPGRRPVTRPPRRRLDRPQPGSIQHECAPLPMRPPAGRDRVAVHLRALVPASIARRRATARPPPTCTTPIGLDVASAPLRSRHGTAIHRRARRRLPPGRRGVLLPVPGPPRRALVTVTGLWTTRSAGGGSTRPSSPRRPACPPASGHW